MKKLALLVALVATVGSAYADGRSELILRQLADRVKALGDYGARFEVAAEGNVTQGLYAVSGERYNIHTGDYDVVSDGRVRWEINRADREVLVDRVNPDDRNILSNPTRAFSFAPDHFTSLYKGIEGGAEVVELTPREKGGALEKVVLKIVGGLPAEIRYRQEGLQSDVVVTITEIKRGVPDGVKFGFDAKEYKGFEVVDFR
jgi:outer membrane lipoprotein-sorting protein